MMELGLKSGISAGFGNAFLIRTSAEAWLLSQELSGFRMAFRVGALSMDLDFFLLVTQLVRLFEYSCATSLQWLLLLMLLLNHP